MHVGGKVEAGAVKVARIRVGRGKHPGNLEASSVRVAGKVVALGIVNFGGYSIRVGGKFSSTKPLEFG